MVNEERRRFLKLAVASASTGILMNDYGKKTDEYEPLLEELDEVIWKNVRLGDKAWDIVEGFSRRDLNYWKDNFFRIRDTILEGGDIDGFQSYSPDEAGVSSPGENTIMRMDGLGRVSGFMKDGKEQIPFEPTRKIKEDEGVYAGIKRGDDVEWFPFDAVVERERPSSGAVRFDYGLDDLEISQEARIVPDDQSGELSFRVENTSDKVIDAELVLYGRINANSNYQNPVFFKSEPNMLEASESLSWNSLETDQSFTIEVDAEVSSSGAFRPEVEQWFSSYGIKSNNDLDGIFRLVLQSLMEESDFDSEGRKSSLAGMFEQGAEEVEARYPSGYLSVPLELEPGEVEDLSVWLDGEPSSTGVWEKDLSGFEDELFSNLLMHVGEEGSGFNAAHNLQPMYYPTWVRDSIFALDVLRKEDEAEYIRDFYTNFLPEVQRDDGSFNQCFYADQSETGTWYSEMDQPAIAALKFPEVDNHFEGDLYNNTEARTSYVASLMRIIENLEEGQLKASPDFAEQPTDFFKQSLWTQSFAYEALKRAAQNYNIELDLSDIDGAPDIVKENADSGTFKLEEQFLRQKAREIRLRADRTYFQGENITDDGLITSEMNNIPGYAKILEDSTLLQDLGRDQEFLESLQHRDDKFWSPGYATYGKVLDQYGIDNQYIKERIRNSRTEFGKLPERVGSSAWRDAMELAWGSAEALDLLRNH